MRSIIVYHQEPYSDEIEVFLEDLENLGEFERDGFPLTDRGALLIGIALLHENKKTILNENYCICGFDGDELAYVHGDQSLRPNGEGDDFTDIAHASTLQQTFSEIKLGDNLSVFIED